MLKDKLTFTEKVIRHLNSRKRKFKQKQIEWRLKRFAFINRLIPKKNIIVILAGSKLAKTKNNDTSFIKTNVPKVEDNALAMANYLAENYPLAIYLIAPKGFKALSTHLVHPRIIIINRGRFKSYFKIWRCKYLFFTHRNYIVNSSKKQLQINLWHGVGHKKFEKLRYPHKKAINADYTVVTSKLTQEFMAKAFGVSQDSAIITGYPRNDWMLEAQQQKEKIVAKIPDFKKYDKILIWMPTFRANQKDIIKNVFSIKNFDIEKFESLLEKNNTLCIVKPHHLVKRYLDNKKSSNIVYIDDFWIYRHQLSLYHLLACTDALITDYSSVMIDYSLLDQPVFCVATDLKEYKKEGELYFEDYENWVPTKLFKNQEEFLINLEEFLISGKDLYQSNRHKIRDLYFEYKDTNSAKRIADIVIGSLKI